MRDERLYWRGPTIWCRVRGAAGRVERRSTGCTDERKAAERADHFERVAADPDHAALSAATLGDAVRLYLADLARRKRSQATKEIAAQKCGHFARFWGEDFLLVKVSAPLLLEYIDKRQREGVTDYTIKRELTHLRQSFRISRHLGLMRGDVDALFPPYFQGTSKTKTRWPTPDEIAKLEKQLHSDRFAHVLYILATGARLGESERAKRSHVRFDVMEVQLAGTKTERAKGAIPITSIMKPILERSLELAPNEGGLLFRKWHRGNIIRDLREACERAGIERLSPNDLRRAFGQWHRRSGVDNALTSKLLRHTTDKLVQTVYANLDAPGVGPLVAKQLDFHGVPFVYAGRVTGRSRGGNEEAKTLDKACARQESNLRHPASKGDHQYSSDESVSVGKTESAACARVPLAYRFPLSEAVGNLTRLRMGVVGGLS